MIWNRKWKRRHGVLGKWRELKLAMYYEYLTLLLPSQNLRLRSVALSWKFIAPKRKTVARSTD